MTELISVDMDEEDFEFANVLTGSALHTKTTKERLMPVRQQRAYLARFLTNRGIPTEELDDLIDPTLHYEENLEEVMNHYGISSSDQSERDIVKDQLIARHRERTKRAQKADEAKKAKEVHGVDQIREHEEIAHKWMAHPERTEIAGVDAPAGARVTPYKLHERTCKSCGKPFIPNRIDQKYCSKKCRAYYHSAAQASRKREAKDKAAKA